MSSPETDGSAHRPEASVASPRLATVGSSLTLSSGAVVSTTPAANATQVRPDTEIGLQLELNEPRFRELANKFQHNAMLVLLNDGGQAVFSTTLDSELRYDAASGRLTLMLPEPLERYTTYGVIITSNELPGFLRQDGLGGKRIPKRPAFTVEELDPESLIGGTQADVARKMEEARARLAEAPPQEAADSEGIPAQVQEQLQRAKALKGEPAPAKLRAPEYVGPRPVRVLEAHRGVSLSEGGEQSGVISQLQGNTVTLFGGRQFTVDEDTHIHVASHPGPDSLADLHPGDLVKVTVNARSEVKNVEVFEQKDLVSFVFKTGSALHEPTHVSLEVDNPEPRVTDGGQFTLVSTDDYGLPAWGSTTSVELKAEDGTELDASARVLPSASFVTSDPAGRTLVRVEDHRAQAVTAKISMNGPNYDGYDAHGLVTTFRFRPGLPAIATLVAPETMEVATTAGIHGIVTDIYGNRAEDASVVEVSASAGEIASPVSTQGGEYHTGFTAPTKVQEVTLVVKTKEGTATASATLRLLPGKPHGMTLQVPRSLHAGEEAVLSGGVVDRYDNAVLDGTVLIFSATAGTLAGSITTTGGGYSLPYVAPTHAPQLVQVAGSSLEGQAQAIQDILIIPGPPASVTLQAQKKALFTHETTALGGQVADRYGNLIEQQPVNLAALFGTLSDTAPATNEAGLYGSTYLAPFYNGVDTVSARAGDVQASVDLSISSAGTGRDPETGQIEPVASLVFDRASYSAAPNQSVVLSGHAYNALGRPLQDVVFSNSSATLGTIESLSFQTDATGRFTLTYRSPTSQATATVSVSSASITATTRVDTLAHGYGYNPRTGQWQKVGSISIDSVRYTLTANQSYYITVFPGTQVEFSGHAYSDTGDPLSQVQFDTLSVTSGSVAVSGATDADGGFSLLYQVPSTEGNQIIQIGSGNTLTSIFTTVSTLGYGFNPKTGAWEAVANIVFKPATYSVYASGVVSLTGQVTNASGDLLSLARVLVTATGGTVTNQVLTSTNGSFSMNYYAPATTGTQVVHGYVDASRYGNATIQVLQPLPPYFQNPHIDVYGSFYSNYFYGTAYWGGRVFNGDGTPMRWGYQDGQYLFAVLDRGYRLFIDAVDVDGDGVISGNPTFVDAVAGYYSIDRYGITYHFFLYFSMDLYDGYHYQAPLYPKSYNLNNYVPIYR